MHTLLSEKQHMKSLPFSITEITFQLIPEYVTDGTICRDFIASLSSVIYVKKFIIFFKPWIFFINSSYLGNVDKSAINL